jgi:hypothetical protein
MELANRLFRAGYGVLLAALLLHVVTEGDVKRLSEKDRLRIRRIAAMRSADRVAAARRRRERMLLEEFERGPARSAQLLSIVGPHGKQLAVLDGEKRLPPSIVSLTANPEETLKFLDDTRESLQQSWIRSAGRAQRRAARRAPVVRSYWDYSSIERIGPDAALVLASEYDRFRRKGGWLPRAIEIEKWQPNVRAELEGVGFLELAGVHERQENFVDVGDRRILKFQANAEADGKQVFATLAELGVGDDLHLVDIYSCIVEAIVNTRQHAYPADLDFSPPHVPNWWLGASFNSRERKLRVSVFDHGATIPRTLPRWERYPMYLRGIKYLIRRDPRPDPLADRFDGAAIATAMAVGRTATEKEYRGKGLAFMESVLNLARGGRLSIISRRGSYTRHKNQKPRYETRRTAIHGTLITWELDL